MRKEVNSLLWGAIGSLVVTAAMTVGYLVGYMPTTEAGALSAQIGAGFFLPWGAAELRNWLARRRP